MGWTTGDALRGSGHEVGSLGRAGFMGARMYWIRIIEFGADRGRPFRDGVQKLQS